MALNDGSTVLIARFSALGDVAMTIPVVYSACRTYPGLRFVMVTRPFMASMFINTPENLTVAGYDVEGPYGGLNGIRRMVGDLIARFRPDLFVDLHNVLRTKVMTLFFKLHRIPTYRIVKPRGARAALTHQEKKVFAPLPTQQSLFLKAFQEAGLPVQDHFHGLFAGPSNAPEELFRDITVPKSPGQKWIGIAPFAAHSGKVYPPELMKQVTALILARVPDVRIFLFGGGGREREILDQWAGKYPECISLAGKKYGFKAELALMNHLDVMLSMDSANMHLAAIAGTQVLSIWGATHPFCGFSPWNQPEENFIQIPMDCRPCSAYGNKPCYRGDYACLGSISPATVADVILKKL